MHCGRAKNLLSAYSDGELTGEQSLAMRRHLALCQECSADLSAIRRVKEALAGLPPREPGSPLPRVLTLQAIRPSWSWGSVYEMLLRFRRWTAVRRLSLPQSLRSNVDPRVAGWTLTASVAGAALVLMLAQTVTRPGPADAIQAVLPESVVQTGTPGDSWSPAGEPVERLVLPPGFFQAEEGAAVPVGGEPRNDLAAQGTGLPVTWVRSESRNLHLLQPQRPAIPPAELNPRY